MRRWQAVYAIVVCATLVAAVEALSPAPAPGGSRCGMGDTRVTICFPGNPESATCVYSIIENYAISDLSPNTYQQDCPWEPLFGFDCEELPGTLYIAYGPCNSNDVVESPTEENSQSVSDWLDVLGMNSIKILGGLYVRGYAFQQSYSTKNVTFLPELEEFSPPNFVGGLSTDVTQVTFSGVTVPPMPKVVTIPAGLTILNSLDEDFVTPPKFSSLKEVSLGISIAGCNRLKTLAGLEMLSTGTALTNIEVINDLILADISALSAFFKCRADGTSLLNPDLVVGTFGMHPLKLQADNKGCTLNTPRQICYYIASGSRCPAGTEYIRFRDGTIQRVSPAPDMAPALAPLSPAAG